MAYFPNGSAAADFEDYECRTCIHVQLGDGCCSVMLVHILYGYDQAADGKRDGDLAATLSILIDDTKPLGKMCTMWVEAE